MTQMPARSHADTAAALSRPLVIVTAQELPAFATALPPGISLLGLVDIADAEVTLVAPGGSPFPLRVAPMLCLGLLATSHDAMARLTTLQARFQSWSTQGFPAPVHLPAGRLHDQLGVLLSTTLVDHLGRMADNAVNLSRELSRLRAAHEDLHNAFSAVEAFLNSSNVQPCSMTFENSADPDAVLRGAMVAEGFTQLIPASSLGLSVLQIGVAAPSGKDNQPGAEPGCHIQLRTVEDDALHADWQITARQLHRGWLTLPLPTGLSGLQRTPKLVVLPTAPGAKLPDFLLGRPQPLARYRITPEGDGEAAPHSLALRCWVGLPGVTPPELGRLADLVQPETRAELHEIALPFPLLHDVKLVSRDWETWFNPLEPMPELRGLTCHPPPSGITVGRIQGFAAHEALRITAQTVVRHPDAAPIEFGLAFTTLDDDDATALITAGETERADGSYFFSGWQRTAYPDTALLALDVASSLPGHADILVATRMADGRENDFGWATFYDFRVTLLGDAANQPPGNTETLPVAVLAAPALRQVVAVSDEAGGSGLVKFSPDPHGVFCHPPPGVDVTIGRLPQPLAADVACVQARPLLANDQARPAAFCLLISDRSVAEVEALLRHSGKPGRLPAGTAMSGWQVVNPGETGLLSVDRPRGRGRDALRLYFATRMAEDTLNDYAWCYFTDLRTLAKNADQASAA